MIKEPVTYKKFKHYGCVQIYNHVYRKTLQIFRGDLKHFMNDCPVVCEGMSYNYMLGCKGLAIGGDKRNVIWLNKLERETLIHELQHIMFYRYNKTCDTIDGNNTATQEFFCYNIEFCLQMIRTTKLFKELKRGKE